MKEINLLGLDQSVFHEKLSNGLNIFLIPLLNKKNYYVNYTTKYGSINLNFIPEDEEDVYNSPMGIAHFLEHKMFEQENGEDPFTFFSKTGTDCNACTSYKKTSYYISGINDIYSNLNYLIDYVNQPYFTSENVEKEKGIIIEEIKMYEDNPDWILGEELLKIVFKNHPIRYDVAGYEETVNKITKDDLYKCYNTFYQPDNMILVVSGNFDKDKVMDVIKNNASLSKRTEKLKINEVKDEEPYSVESKYKEIVSNNIVIPKIGIDIKLSMKDVEDKYNYFVYMNCLLSLLFGSGSSFKEEMFKKGYASYINCSSMLVDDFFIIEFYIEGTHPQELLDEIVYRFKNTEISSEELNRYKKVLIASSVMESDNVSVIADSLISDYINFGKVIDDKIEIIRKIDYEDFKDFRKKVDLDNYSIVVVRPNK